MTGLMTWRLQYYRWPPGTEKWGQIITAMIEGCFIGATLIIVCDIVEMTTGIMLTNYIFGTK